MQYEAEIPAGMRAGETFMAQTPYGVSSVQVPEGYRPGQRIRFTAGGSDSWSRPQEQSVVVGRPMGDGAYGGPYGGGGGGGDFGDFGQGRGQVYRADPSHATVQGVPLLQGMPAKQAERKVEEIHKGGELAREHPPFPEKRPYRDLLWVLPFIAVVVAVVVLAVIYAPGLGKEISSVDSKIDWPSAGSIAIASGVGAAVSLCGAMAFAMLAWVAPGCVVWTSLLFGPTLWVVFGGLAILASQAVLGFILLLVGALGFACVFICWRPFIPFTIRILEMVSGVMRKHPGLVGVSFVGSVIGIAWSILWGLAFAGLYQQVKGGPIVDGGASSTNTSSSSEQGINSAEWYGFLFGGALVFYWGAQTIYNTCHVTYCGVFGRWYFEKEQHSLVKSAGVALTTSFGSICFGSFLVAVIRAIEAVVRSARRDAAESGNVLSCILLMIVECFVACIGDLLEYFSEWAYVQCAVRGVSFLQAARITYSMMTCANMEYVISDLLLNSVVVLGACLCGLLAGGCAALAGWIVSGSTAAATGGIIGVWAGLVAGGSAVGILNSGAKTILALWAEDPTPLLRLKPDMHQELEEKIVSKL